MSIADDLNDAIEVAEERLNEAFDALADGAHPGAQLWYRLHEAAYNRLVGDTEWYREALAHVHGLLTYGL